MEQNYMESLLEEMRGKFNLVLEGHAVLNAKIDEFRRESNERHDLTEFMLKALAAEVSEIRVDLVAHRSGTEAHPRYQVRE